VGGRLVHDVCQEVGSIEVIVNIVVVPVVSSKCENHSGLGVPSQRISP
jgi:hypothetical protein